MKIHTEIVYNVPLLTGFYLFPPAFYNSLEMVKKSAKLNEPQLNCFLCMSSVQLWRGINYMYMHHFSFLTMTINRVNP